MYVWKETKKTGADTWNMQKRKNFPWMTSLHVIG